MTFSNNSDQRERRQVIKNDAATLHDFAQSEAGEISGRWAKPTQVSGSEGAVHMPRLPANSPWSQPDPSGQEKPYPIDLSEPLSLWGQHKKSKTVCNHSVGCGAMASLRLPIVSSRLRLSPRLMPKPHAACTWLRSPRRVTRYRYRKGRAME